MTDPFAAGLLDRIPPPRRVTIVRASRLGDFLCATPALRALRRRLPNAEITLVALEYIRDLAERCRYIDRFVPFPGWPGIAAQFFDARRAATFFQHMQAQQFDLAVQMHGSGVNANPFTLMLGARWTVGYIRPGDDPGLLDAAVPLPGGHEIDRALALTTFLGAEPDGSWTDAPILPADRHRADDILRGVDGPLIGVHAGARDAVKRWPPGRFAVAATNLQGTLGGTIVLLGDGEERERSAAVSAQLPGPHVDLTGKLTLATLSAVIERLAVLLTNDSGPAHVAYALDIPSVTIFGGTKPGQWAALDRTRHRAVAHPIGCRPCSYEICPIGFECLMSVSPDGVTAEAKSVIARPR